MNGNQELLKEILLDSQNWNNMTLERGLVHYKTMMVSYSLLQTYIHIRTQNSAYII